MKRIVRITLLLLIAAFSVAPVFAAKTVSLSNFKQIKTYSAGQFTDVKSGDWYESSVKTAYELGLVKGSSSTTYNPKGSITIAETIALASRLHSIYHTGTAEFVQGSIWYQVYVDYAVENSIIAEGSFEKYTSAATRSQFASILANALDESALEPINTIELLPDVTGSEEYGEAVYSLYRAGILTGSDSKGTFNPNSNIQRSEVAAIVTRMADKNSRKSKNLTQCDVLGHTSTKGTCERCGKILEKTQVISIASDPNYYGIYYHLELMSAFVTNGQKYQITLEATCERGISSWAAVHYSDDITNNLIEILQNFPSKRHAAQTQLKTITWTADTDELEFCCSTGSTAATLTIEPIK